MFSISQDLHFRQIPLNRMLLAILLLLLPFTGAAQMMDTLAPTIPTDILESLLEQQESEDGNFDNNDFLEEMELLMSRRINLNYTSIEELMRTNVLTQLQALSIINYVNTFGPMRSIYELKAVIGLDKATIDLLLPFVTVGPATKKVYTLKEQLTKGRHTFIYRYQQVLEQARGFTPPDTLSNGNLSSRYQGDRTRQFIRYRYQFLNGISYGITMEKDPGEQYIQPGAKLGIDYISAHLFLENIGRFRYIALGDYEVNLGQGLLSWQSFGIGKSVAVNNIKRTAQVLRPHTSVVEDNFNRGAGATMIKGAFEVTAFASYRLRSASISVLDTLDEIIEVSSLQTSGLHRTPTELRNRNAIELFTSGGRAGWKGRRLSIYANATYNRLSATLTRQDQPYNRFAFNGRELFNASLDYSYLGNKFNFFGESAMSQNGGMAFLHGINVQPVSSVTLSLLHRYYAKDFHTLFGNAFAESTLPVNEHGLFAGASFKIHPKILINNYIDIYQFPWLRFRIDAPNTNGLDILHEWVYRHSRKLEFYARFRWETKARNAPDDAAPIDYVLMTTRSSIRLNMNYRASENWIFRTRAEMSFFDDGFSGLSKGYLFYQDIGYNHPSGRWNISARYAIFNTDNFDTRIYAYESDVLYSFSIPPYLGRGQRTYVVTKFRLHRRVDLWLRYAQTFRNDVAFIGSGLDQLPSNTRSDIRAQIRVKL
jgi:opacity protein-like surface antigen